jgi:thiol-disulfide isomerase/thioredoxin
LLTLFPTPLVFSHDRITFYAPWCSHCKEVAPIWEEVAVYFHKNPDKKIRVGKINGDAERALISRFGVTGFPSFYYIRGYRVYEYDGNRHKLSFIDFAETGYKKASPIPFLSSPMGPLGLCQGLFLHLAYGAFNTLEWMQNDLGFSPFFSIMFLFGSIFIGIFITIVTAAITLTPKDKHD